MPCTSGLLPPPIHATPPRIVWFTPIRAGPIGVSQPACPALAAAFAAFLAARTNVSDCGSTTSATER